LAKLEEELKQKEDLFQKFKSEIEQEGTSKDEESNKLNSERAGIIGHMKKLTVISRFDLDYLDDAIIFTKGENSSNDPLANMKIKRPSEKTTA